MLLIGLVGQSCSGKNEVAKILEELGFCIIDADEISRSLFRQCEKEIMLLFKDELNKNKKCLKKNGEGVELDKRRFSTLLFSIPDLLKKMEDFILPKITIEIQKKIALLSEKNKDVKIVLNAPTLHKTTLFPLCSFMIYVKANIFIRLFRAVKRDGFSPLNIYKRFLSQDDFPSQYILRKSDIIFVNNNSSRAKLEDCLKKKLSSVGSRILECLC